MYNNIHGSVGNTSVSPGVVRQSTVRHGEVFKIKLYSYSEARSAGRGLVW